MALTRLRAAHGTCRLGTMGAPVLLASFFTLASGGTEGRVHTDSVAFASSARALFHGPALLPPRAVCGGKLWTAQRVRAAAHRPLCMEAAAPELLQSKPKQPAVLNVYVFLTIVGWGKNILMEQIQALPPKEMAEVFGTGLPPAVLESDAIGAKRFWPRVRRTIIDTDTPVGTHLFLNKNFPPNAWTGARKKLEEFCAEGGVSLRLHAIVPESSGEAYNPFSLLDLAVTQKPLNNLISLNINGSSQVNSPTNPST